MDARVKPAYDAASISETRHMIEPLHQEELGWVISVLESPLKSGEHLLQFTAQPNGFWCVSFGPLARDKSQIRLHLWPGGVVDGDVHDHAWNYSSLCVFGSLEMTTFEAASEGQSYAHYLCRSTGNSDAGKGLELEFCRRAYLKPALVRTIRGGERYSLGANELHRVASGGGAGFTAITLMKRNPYLTDFTNVYVALGETERAAARLKRINRNVPFDPMSPEMQWCVEKLKERHHGSGGHTP